MTGALVNKSENPKSLVLELIELDVYAYEHEVTFPLATGGRRIPLQSALCVFRPAGYDFSKRQLCGDK